MTAHCTCAAWRANIGKLDAPFVVAAARNPDSSSGYDGEPFGYCPWCGTGLTAAASTETTAPADEYERLKRQKDSLVAAERGRLERKEALFQRCMAHIDWLQEHLDDGRWAGHNVMDAAQTELLESRSQLAALREEHETMAAELRLIDLTIGNPLALDGFATRAEKIGHMLATLKAVNAPAVAEADASARAALRSSPTET